MIRRKEKGIETALLVYVFMILMVIGFRVKSEAQAPWGYGWGQGYYPAWGSSPYPFFGSFQPPYQWGGPQYTAWGQQPYAFAPASYGSPGYYGQVNGYNATRQSAVFGGPVPPEIAALFFLIQMNGSFLVKLFTGRRHGKRQNLGRRGLGILQTIVLCRLILPGLHTMVMNIFYTRGKPVGKLILEME